MSELNDPRVLFAAERTLLAWIRTASGLIAMGFFVERTSLFVGNSQPRGSGLWVGLTFVLLGAALSLLSATQYRRAIADLRPIEIPNHYWVNLSVFTSLIISLLAIVLAVYMVIDR